MKKDMTSPMTRQRLTHALTPNHALLRRIRAWEQARKDFDLEVAKYESAIMVRPPPTWPASPA